MRVMISGERAWKRDESSRLDDGQAIFFVNEFTLEDFI
jgi:hypothetical protein